MFNYNQYLTYPQLSTLIGFFGCMFFIMAFFLGQAYGSKIAEWWHRSWRTITMWVFGYGLVLGACYPSIYRMMASTLGIIIITAIVYFKAEDDVLNNFVEIPLVWRQTKDD